MLSSFWGIFVILFILVVPGLLWRLVLDSKFKSLTLLDSAVAVLLMSGSWNLLFFLPRLAPAFRISVYLVGLAGLIGFCFFKRRSVFRLKIQNKNLLIIPLITLLLGTFFLGYPYHQDNLNRLQLNPVGGDVNFHMYKTHLLRAGYSLWDDPYADQVTFYPLFINAEVALSTLLNGGDMAFQAETFRVVLSVIFFFLFFAIGRALTLKEAESLFFALSMLFGYSIWSHYDGYYMPSMGLFTMFMFLYWMMRAFTLNQKTPWALAGLAAGLVVHTHPVHAVFAGLFSTVTLLAFIGHQTFRRIPFKKTLNDLSPFLFVALIVGGLYLFPMLLRYGYNPTSDYHLYEEFTTTFSEYIRGLFRYRPYQLTLFLSLVTWIGAFFTRNRPRSFFTDLLPPVNLFMGIFLLTMLVKLFAIRTHRLALFLDTSDITHIAQALSWTLLMVIFFKLLKWIFTRFKPFSLKLEAGFQWSFVVLFLLIIFPPSPLSSLRTEPLERYGNQIWSLTSLPKAEGERSHEGNIEASWDAWAEASHELLPLYTSVVLVHPGIAHGLSSYFERQMIHYYYPHSNLFLEPSYRERDLDLKVFYDSPNESKLRSLIKKYGITHVFFSWQEGPELLDVLTSSSFMAPLPQHYCQGRFYEVNVDQL